ncbi:MAG: YraN family protein [Alphaproteobacteria bacterium]|nr:YraN family protein [Alphaproteobacteria bacterium]MDX5369247.1 YraN family protein [Alphaproteobacteria bacterium]MDX5463936.1 YraN family protein [Alphaproteobacteria bacterium]
MPAPSPCPAEPPQAKVRAERAGRLAETLAAWVLRLKGFRVLERRVRTPVGEIDLVAMRGALVLIVEVKRRPTHAEALAAVTPRQRHRLARAAAWLMARDARLAGADMRFDVVSVDKWMRVRHLSDAWRE